MSCQKMFGFVLGFRSQTFYLIRKWKHSSHTEVCRLFIYWILYCFCAKAKVSKIFQVYWAYMRPSGAVFHWSWCHFYWINMRFEINLLALFSSLKTEFLTKIHFAIYSFRRIQTKWNGWKLVRVLISMPCPTTKPEQS